MLWSGPPSGFPAPLRPCRHAAELSKWEALVAEARREQAAAAAAAHEAQRAQQLAEASRGVLAGLERALDAREAKLQDRWAGMAWARTRMQAVHVLATPAVCTAAVCPQPHTPSQ